MNVSTSHLFETTCSRIGKAQCYGWLIDKLGVVHDGDRIEDVFTTDLGRGKNDIRHIFGFGSARYPLFTEKYFMVFGNQRLGKINDGLFALRFQHRRVT